MAKFLEYILSLKDRMSAPLRGVTSGAGNADKQVRSLKNDVDDLDKSFRKASGGMSVFTVAAGNVVSAGIMGLGRRINDFSRGAVNATIQREQDLIGLTTFLGDNARKVYDAIEHDAAVTPFGLDSLLSVNRGLISTGMNAEKARADALNLANAVAAVGGSEDVLIRMGANMQQISNVGKATALDIKQFAFAGINIYALLSKATGKSVKQVQEMEISYDLLSKALEKSAQKGGLYYGASEKMSKSMGGLWSTIKDRFSKFMADTGDRMRPYLEKAIGYIDRFLDKTPQILDALEPVIAFVGDIFFFLFKAIGWVIDRMPKILDALKPVLSVIGDLFFLLIDAIKWLIGFFQSWYQKIQEGNPLVIFFTAALMGLIGAMVLLHGWSILVAAKTKLWTAAQWLLNSSMLANPLTWVIASILTLIGLIGYVIYRYNGWGEAWKNLVGFFENSWYAFRESFRHTFLQVVNAFLKGVEAMQRAWYKFKKLWDRKAANEALENLNAQANERAKELAESAGKIDEFNKMAKESWNKIGLTDSNKSAGDFVNDLKKKFGIEPAKQPGQEVNTKFTGADGGTAKGGKDKSSQTVATGGTKNTTIHITIGKQIEQITVVASNIREGAQKIRDIVVDEMTRAIAMSQAIAD
jgi:hypothetical protein